MLKNTKSTDISHFLLMQPEWNSWNLRQNFNGPSFLFWLFNIASRFFLVRMNKEIIIIVIMIVIIVVVMIITVIVIIIIIIIIVKTMIIIKVIIIVTIWF